ncbi:DUF4238 domain-containing protein [Deinococcus multiflagellatus]|uniref:DUF4238 domain-containing protein n=1 Tax=Deinococcus multiflagellatus TaxID=1656887 RepID=A0ABW1ZRC8_9DEIO|nr:DUF4238 domain-containing protein [Deinococcus multiflagellatus]MBZ9715536.1 DUF4238 domain-containing protein [Deinococcus multiflagellatus]
MAGKQKPARRHHVVPKFYLKHWTQPDGRMFAFHLPREQLLPPVKPAEVAYVKGFHTVIGAARPDEFEHWLSANVEDPLARVHQKTLTSLRQQRLLPADLRADLDSLTAYQMLRLPRTRELVKPLLKEAGVPGPLDDSARAWHLEFLRGTDSFVLNMVLESLAEFQLAVLRAPPNRSFWASDAPVLALHDAIEVRSSSHGFRSTTRSKMGRLPGLKHPRAQLYFPLAPDLTAAYFRTSPLLRPYEVQPATRSNVDWVNERTMAHATQLVFGLYPIAPQTDMWQRIKAYREEVAQADQSAKPEAGSS